MLLYKTVEGFSYFCEVDNKIKFVAGTDPRYMEKYELLLKADGSKDVSFTHKYEEQLPSELVLTLMKYAVRVALETPDKALDLAKKLISRHVPVNAITKLFERMTLMPDPVVSLDLLTYFYKEPFSVSDNGCFLAYKVVDSNRMDLHSNTIYNGVGYEITMDRQQCNSDRKDVCVPGLHVGNFTFVSHFGGSIMMVVEVDPVDVVAAPKCADKFRCCRYKVLFDLEDKRNIGCRYVSNSVVPTEDEQEVFVEVFAKENSEWESWELSLLRDCSISSIPKFLPILLRSYDKVLVKYKELNNPDKE